MALPTCPACKQSVLDDDATECPFCGASMSGTPGAAPAAPTSQTQPKAAPKKKVAKPADPGDDDHPFDAPAPTMGKVVQLLPKPVKGKLHKVECPMCETAGFTSKKAAGREVRCANKECLVPVFTAPPLEPQEEAPRSEQPAVEKTPMPIAVKLILVTVVSGAGLWALAEFVLFKNPDSKEDVITLPGNAGKTAQNGTTKNGDSTDANNQANGNKTDVNTQQQPVGPTTDELRKQALDQMIVLSQKTAGEGNDNKELCRKLTAEAYAVVGDTEESTAQLNQLVQLTNGERLKYYGVLALIESAWPAAKAGNTAAAGLIVDQIKELMPLVPANRSLAIDFATEFAVLLVALDRNEEAKEVIKTRTNTGRMGQFMESYSRCQFTRTFDLNQAAEMQPVGGWAGPQWVAVTVGLVSHDLSGKSLKWAQSAPSPRVVNESVAAWAEATLLKSRDVASLAAINVEIDKLAEPSKSWAKARIALTLALIGQAEAAKTTLAQVSIKIDPAAAPADFVLPGLKEIYEMQVGNGEVGRVRSLTAAEVAHTHLLLGDRDTAWKAIQVSLSHARNSAPSQVLVAQLFAEMSRGEDAMIRRFKNTLNLVSAQAGRNAYLKYRANCTALGEIAKNRASLQESVLIAATEWGFASNVWSEIKSRATGPALQREAWFETGLPSILHSEFRGKEDQATVADIEQTVSKQKLAENHVGRSSYDVVSWRYLNAGEIAQAVNSLNRFKPQNDEDVHWLREIMMRQASKLAASGNAEGAIQFASKISDNEKLLRGMVVELIASRVASSGDAKVLFDFAKQPRTYPPDAVAALRGFIEGVRGQ